MLDGYWQASTARRRSVSQRRVQRVRRAKRQSEVTQRNTVKSSDRIAIELVESGAVETYPDAYRMQGCTDQQAKDRSERIRRRMREGVPAVVDIAAEARTRSATTVQWLLAAKVEAAEEGLTRLRAMLSEEIPPELKVKIAQDFLDRVPESSKITRQEIDTRSTLALPAHKAEGLMAALARASAAMSRSVVDTSGHPIPDDIQEVPCLPVAVTTPVPE